MMNFLRVACGVSVFGLAYAAHAGGGFQLSVANQFPPMCKIGTTPTYSLDTTAHVTNSTTNSPSIDFGSNFSNRDATGREISGSVRFAVYANAQCNYVLTSAYGALKNVTAGQTGAFRDYYANAYDVSGSGTPVHLNSLTSNAPVNQFTIPAPVYWGLSTVAIDFKIPPTSTPLAAGQYQDILLLTINPTI
jgi:hypothetical protein